MYAACSILFSLLVISTQAQPPVQPDSARATIVLFRDRGIDPLSFTDRLSYGIWINDKRVCTIDPRRYLMYTVEPGPVRIRAGRRALFSRSRSELRLEAEPGGVYYIAGIAHETRDRSWLILHHIPERVALPRLTTMQPDPCMLPTPVRPGTTGWVRSSGEGL